MAGNESAPPDSDGAGSDAEEAAWEMATAETLRARGELAEAANWYRRAANHLMEAGDDERAIAVAKLAAELAALDDAGRPPPARAPAPAPREEKKPAPPPPARAQAPAQPAAKPAPMPPVQPTLAPRPVPRPAASVSPPRSDAERTLPRPSVAVTTATRDVAARTSARPLPLPTRSVAAPVAPGSDDGFDDEPATTTFDLRNASASMRPVVPAVKSATVAVSPLAAMLDEAVSHLDELPSTPLSGAPRPTASRRPMSFLPERMAESDTIAARLPALPLFSDLPAGRVREVAKQAGIVRYDAGDLLCEAGAPEGPMYVVIEGAAWVGLAGEDAPAAIVGAGDFVGEITALYGGPRTATVRAQAHVEAVALPPSLVRALAREFDAFRETLREAAVERMSETLPRVAPLFRKLDEGERAAVFAMFQLSQVPEGALLLAEGELAEGIFIVAAGEAELYGGEFGVNRSPRARMGEALGVSSSITGEPSGVSARATRDMLVARLARVKVREVVARFPRIATALSDVGAPGRGVIC